MAQHQPAARAVDALADVRDQHDHQQQQRDDEQPGRHALPGRQRHLEGQQAGDEGDSTRNSACRARKKVCA
jgi:hypothetical protein